MILRNSKRQTNLTIAQNYNSTKVFSFKAKYSVTYYMTNSK